jgi:hypothetical protein
MAEDHRHCGTCRFYEPSPIWRRGWCRNTVLHRLGYSHPVQEDEHDCRRGRSDFWEPADDDQRAAFKGHQVKYRGNRL